MITCWIHQNFRYQSLDNILVLTEVTDEGWPALKIRFKI